MKKKILCTLLCVSMVLATIGCGAKETTSTNVTVNTEDAQEETKETPQEENEESSVEETTNDIIVNDERPESLNVGKTYKLDCGTYSIIDSNNGLDTIKIEFYGQAFKAIVPQDIGALGEGNGSNQVDIANKDQSKLLKSWFSLDMEDKVADDAMTEDEWRNFLTDSTYEDGYYFSKEWVNDNLLKIVFEANFNSASGHNLHGYAVFYTDYENGGSFQYFYGEDINIYNEDVVKLVIDSIEMIPTK